MNVVIIVQARTGSTRLPGKVMLPCAGGTVLGRMLERVTATRTAAQVVVATTDLPDDDAIVDVARAAGVPCYRGHPTDLLDRHVRAGRAHRADIVVKIPSDCPLIDPHTIDRVIGAYLARAGEVDYVSNLHPATWPDGCDVEVVPLAVLETAWREAQRTTDREHTTPYLWEQPSRFRLHNVRWETGRDHSRRYRMTLDYPEDYVLIRSVYAALWSQTRVFPLAEILAFLEKNPKVSTGNARHLGSTWHRPTPQTGATP